jgi:hypothetical protein
VTAVNVDANAKAVVGSGTAAGFKADPVTKRKVAVSLNVWLRVELKPEMPKVTS